MTETQLIITYRLGEDASAENERALLAAAYDYILSCHEIENGAQPGAPDAARTGN